MPGMYEIRWLPDGETKKFAGSRGNYYELSESDRIDLHSTPVWCHPCQKVRHGEHLSTLEALDEQIRDLQDPSSLLYRMTGSGFPDPHFGKGETFLQQRLAELARRRKWRETRQSPPKCIYCGSIDILALPLGKPVPSPRGVGQLQINCVGMCSTSFNEWFFTPEGDRISRNTTPTYWHHPELDTPESRKRLQEFLRSLPKGSAGG